MERLIILFLSRYNQTIDSTKEFLNTQKRVIKTKAGRYGGTYDDELYMTMENAVFNFVFADASFPVRTVTIDNEPWFVAKDVADAIGVVNVHTSLANLDESEKKTISNSDSTFNV